MKTYRIVHKTGWLAACGFYSLERALAWLADFNPDHYVEKGLTVEDFTVEGETK